MEPETRESLSQRRGIKDLTGTQAALASLQVWVSHRPQHHQPCPPVPHQSGQFSPHPCPTQTHPLICPSGRPRCAAPLMLRMCHSTHPASHWGTPWQDTGPSGPPHPAQHCIPTGQRPQPPARPCREGTVPGGGCVPIPVTCRGWCQTRPPAAARGGSCRASCGRRVPGCRRCG